MITVEDLIRQISDLTGIPSAEFNEKTALYGSGVISSLMMLELMSDLEKKYHIYIRPEELIEDNFSDIGSLKTFIECKRKEDSPS